MDLEKTISSGILNQLPILGNISVLETIKCISGNHGSIVCFKNGCQHYPFMCGNRKCSCRNNHQNCMKTQVLQFIEKFENRITDLSNLVDYHNNQIEKTIKKLQLQMNHLKVLFKTQIHRKLKDISFSQKQLQFLTKIQQNKVEDMKGEDFFKVYQEVSLTTSSQDKFNEEKKVKAIQIKWQNVQKKILGQIQDIQITWKQNINKNQIYNEEHIEEQKAQQKGKLFKQQQLKLAQEKQSFEKYKQKLNYQLIQQKSKLDQAIKRVQTQRQQLIYQQVLKMSKLEQDKRNLENQKQKLKNQQSQQRTKLEEQKKYLQKQKQQMKNQHAQQQLKIQQDRKNIQAISQKLKIQQVQQKQYQNQNFLLIKSQIVQSKKQCQDIIRFLENKQVIFQLKYRSSGNKYQLSQFCENTDKVRATLFLIKTQHGNKIGAFTSLRWKSLNCRYFCRSDRCRYDCPSAQYLADKSKSTFIFSLTYNQKLSLKDQDAGIVNNPHYGPIFGMKQKYAFGIGQNNTTFNSSFVSFGNVFFHPNYRQNNKQMYKRFTGSSTGKFNISQFQVWEITFK